MLTRRQWLRGCGTLLLGMLSGFAAAAPLRAANLEQRSVRRRLRWTVTLTNPKPKALHDQILWLYGPVGATPTQHLEAIDASVPFQVQSDRLGQSVIRLAFPQFAPLAAKVVNVTAEVVLHPLPAPTAETAPQRWLGAERLVEIDDSRIRSLAAELRRARDRDTALAIYDWVRRNLNKTAYGAGDRGALDALARLGGDCTEHARLAVALARANGIPARVVEGYVVDRDRVLSSTEYHDWTEMYFDGAWRLADTHGERWLTPAEQYVAFHHGGDEALNPIGPAPRYRLQGELEVRY